MMVNAIVKYHGTLKGNSWARWMNARTSRQNKNNLIAFVGTTGSGKTWSAISVAEIISELNGVPFGIENIVFSLKDLMDLINGGTLKKGSTIIFDEPQVSISAKNFQSQANKVFNLLVSTFRHRNLSLFFCTPFESLLDKSTRKLFHARFETMSINRKNNTCRLKPRFIEYTDWKDEPYRKQLIVFFKDKEGQNKIEKLFYWDVPKPNEELIELYEQKKLDFTDKLNLNISESLRKFDESGKSMTAEVQKNRKELTDKQKEAMVCIANIKKPSRYVEAGKILGVDPSTVNVRVKYAKKKGYTLEEFKENE